MSLIKMSYNHKDIDGVKELLMIYDKANEEKARYEATGEIKEYPLIVLEGLDGSGFVISEFFDIKPLLNFILGKSSISKRVAKK
ncbi:hypothetical protein NQ314_017608 [Rhamnusium bicolor]|uniref:Uncharacterized protein n=1 Tax=Rhamnusium bicolor TaxID=1586634 RepID=A0AAV8WVD6_9CUCU|nr:hypothetical protein NQ314_017608 [Rhamnusium bicolor]